MISGDFSADGLKKRKKLPMKNLSAGGDRS
jgi:hypothetical protein